MSPDVTAAYIAAGVGVLTVATTVVTQYLGRRATSKQLDKTVAEQQTRTLNERFATAAEQLGSEKPAVRSEAWRRWSLICLFVTGDLQLPTGIAKYPVHRILE
jgi:hypothetical protein